MKARRDGIFWPHRVAALCVALGVLTGIGSWASPASAGEVELTPCKDASLYSYDFGIYNPSWPSTYPKADGRSHLHVGDTNKNNGVQRGLIRFDLSGIPNGAVVIDVSLTMVVAKVPNRALQRDMNFWMIAMEGLSEAWPWSQGPGGEQSPAVPGDTTWFHTTYNPALHGELGDTSGNEFRGFESGEPGNWLAPGYFGDADLLETATGAGVGGPFDDAHALALPSGVGEDRASVGDVVNWSNTRLIDDVQSWVDGTKDNFGWIMIGEEWIDENETVIRPDTHQEDFASSKIDFFSSESAWPYYSPPTLSVTYATLPGDANGDDFVDDDDIALLAANWQRYGDATWGDGDFNGDHQVDDIDATILAANWHVSNLAGQSTSVPEASIFVLLVSGLAALLWRSRR